MRFIILLFVTLFSVQFTQAQSTISDGYISYAFSIDSDEPAAALLAMGASLEVAFKGSKTKAVGKVSGGNSVTITANHTSGMGLSLMDIMGEKKAVKLGSKEFSKAKEDLDKISDNPMRYTDDTKNIAGYECQKVFMKHKESGANIILYITDKIKPKSDPFAKLLMAEIKGFPLGIVIKKDDTTVRLTADKVSSQTPSDGAFSTEVPSGYTLTTIEELEQSAKQKIEEKR